MKKSCTNLFTGAEGEEEFELCQKPENQRVSRSALQSNPSVSDGKEHHLKNKKSAVYSVLQVRFLWVISVTRNVFAQDIEGISI